MCCDPPSGSVVPRSTLIVQKVHMESQDQSREVAHVEEKEHWTLNLNPFPVISILVTNLDRDVLGLTVSQPMLP